jgi:peptidoglycan/LPS O-acetylase OafA/YrhL
MIAPRASSESAPNVPDLVPSSAATPTSGHYIPSLDGIRAVSFMLVFGAHAGLGALLPADLGVTVFFFLSGFLITTLMRIEFEKNGSVNIRHFLLRRALRILPPFFAMMLIATLIALTLYPPGAVRGSAVTAELLFYTNYWYIYGNTDFPPGTDVVWSLAVEEHFYLLFPWLYIAMQKWRMPRQRQALLLWALCAAILAWRCLLFEGLHAPSGRIYVGTDSRLDSILFGCALAVWNNPVLDRPARPPRQWKYLLLPAALIALLSCTLYDGPVFKHTWYFSIQGVALALVFTSAMRFHRWPLFRFLNYRPVAFIGVLSYSLYLVHLVVLSALRQMWPHLRGWPRPVVALAAAMVTAWMIYRLIERPCARLRRKLTR